MTVATTPSSYLQLLPAIYAEGDGFLGRFLLAFEQVLTGLPGDPRARGLEQAIADIALLFDPLTQDGFLAEIGATPQARKDFLGWLSGWVALSRRVQVPADQQRAFVAGVAQSYRRRGTREGLTALLKIYLAPTALITEGDALPADEKGFPHHFHVTIHLQAGSQAAQDKLEEIGATARALIELQKPAHATYTLEFKTPTLRILASEKQDGIRTAMVGVDTTLTQFTDP